MVDYTSDHDALKISVTIKSTEKINFISESQKGRFMYKRANWEKFTKHLKNNYKIKIPINRNLAILEIDSYLLQMDKCIVEAIKTCIPRFNQYDNTLNYVNNKITKMQKNKSKLVSILKQMRRQGYTEESPLLISLRAVLTRINGLLKSEFKNTYLKYWAKEQQAIDFKVAESFFPKITKYFRPKNNLEINSLHVEDHSLQRRCNIDPGKMEGVNGRCEFVDADDKLKVMGAFYEKINSPRYTNLGTVSKRKVDKLPIALAVSFLNAVL